MLRVLMWYFASNVLRHTGRDQHHTASCDADTVHLSFVHCLSTYRSLSQELRFLSYSKPIIMVLPSSGLWAPTYNWQKGIASWCTLLCGLNITKCKDVIGWRSHDQHYQNKSLAYSHVTPEVAYKNEKHWRANPQRITHAWYRCIGLWVCVYSGSPRYLVAESLTQASYTVR